MISYISASYVFPVAGPPIKNGVVGVEIDGTIIHVFTPEEAINEGVKDITQYEGLLVPGFVNTHCHLELSHLKGQIETRTGLLGFVQAIMKLRTSDEEAIDLAMLRADREMFENGIVAVGDISNQVISRGTKLGSPIYYHTFLEVMGFNPLTAQESIKRALEFKEKFNPLKVSIVPHAPYSVSAALFKELRINGETNDEVISIHNQETEDENLFFERKEGAFLDLYRFLGLDIDFYKPSGKTSLQTYLPMLSDKLKTLLVHNTFTSVADVEFAEAYNPDLYWCLCPNANLYIENRLPDVEMLRNSGAKITLGTDSLASNNRLSIFAEMQTLQINFGIDFDELLKWATINGAEFLGVQERYGSLEVGKRPGINLIDFEEISGIIMLGSRVERLF
ncbi:amidohydrolase family protein [Pedobacter foliorum]|uniref:amidohydrolase family protein n=1 Tax=Pedobacter foliorum TaxID=2739058 RepID=UPI001565265A|nr:amidohydrolase family protein [Pedobacter foliorum]NRF39236.1 amidohydrolase family protein [Pedobacter foliorum]